MNFAVLDLVLLGGVGLFAMSWSARGFTRQMVSWLTLALGLWVAWQFEALAAAWLEPWIASLALRRIAAFLGLLLVVSYGGAALARAVGKMVSGFGGGSLDRLFGFLSGVLVGAMICWGVLIGLQYISPQLASQRWWQESQLIPMVFMAEQRVRSELDRLNGGDGQPADRPAPLPVSTEPSGDADTAAPVVLPDAGW